MYTYVLIDKLEKTISLREYENNGQGCYAGEIKRVKKEYGLTCHDWQMDSRFRILYNEQKNYIDYETLYKYARNYRAM